MDRSPRTLDSATLARRYGREMAAAAYVILENRHAAERAAAGGIADFLRQHGQPDESEPCLDHRLISLALRRALVGDRRQHEIDPLVDETLSRSLAPLSALQRAAAMANLIFGASLTELGVALGESEDRLRDALRIAIRLGDGSERLSRVLAAQVADVSLSVTPGAVANALATPPPEPRRPPQAALFGAAAIVFVSLATWMGTSGFAPRPGSGPVRSTPAPSAAANILEMLPGSVGNGILQANDSLRLDDCQIHPSTTRLSYRGWLTVGDLTAGGNPAESSRPIYALITATPAKWVGTRPADSAASAPPPPPVARLACVVDPSEGTSAVYVVPRSWRPPPVVDGCPTTDVHRYGAFEEIGGPGVFVVLPRGDASWRAEDPGLELYLRVPSEAPSDADISAAADPVGGGTRIQLPVKRMSTSPPGTPAGNVYLALAPAEFPRAGCWSVSVTVDGVVAGTAVIPVAEAE